MIRLPLSLFVCLGLGVAGHGQEADTPPKAVATPSAVPAPPFATQIGTFAAQIKPFAVQANPSGRPDPLREIQAKAIETTSSPFGHWGVDPNVYSSWINHSNRLVPVYTFGLTLDALREEGSIYSDAARLKKLYGRVPDKTVNPTATYFDQTDIYRLQLAAVDAGYSHIIVMVFDGMDWQTTRATSLYKHGKMTYESGRGRGLAFQDERRMHTDFGLVVSSPLLTGAKTDVNAQTVIDGEQASTGGYDPTRGGDFPWREQSGRDYLIGLDKEVPHGVTDSASSGTSLFSGIKTFNESINFRGDGSQVVPLARTLQAEQDFKIGIVTSVPGAHATTAAAYANNVSRKDYQDLARDMIGLASASHRQQALPGVDVLLGGGWGEMAEEDELQGANFMAGNPYLHQEDLDRVNIDNGGKYVVVQRKAGQPGRQTLMAAAHQATDEDHRLVGLFGAVGGHLPFRTADGQFNPTIDMKGGETYAPADISENPSLAEMTEAALLVLEQSIEGFWLLIEAGDVDWANHANNIDNSVGAVLSGEEAFKVVMNWIDENNAWDYTAVIVTADHGHYLVIDDASRIIEAGASAKRP